MARRHPNQTQLEAATGRWIAEASGRPNRSALLAAKADWLLQQLAILGRDDLPTPAHLKGLVAADLIVAEGALRKAATPPPPAPTKTVHGADWGAAADAGADLPEREAFAYRSHGQTIIYVDPDCRNLIGWFNGYAAEGDLYSCHGRRHRLTIVESRARDQQAAA